MMGHLLRDGKRRLCPRCGKQLSESAWLVTQDDSQVLMMKEIIERFDLPKLIERMQDLTWKSWNG